MSESSKKISASYDEDADVLYVALGRPVPADGQFINGVIYRYSLETKLPCGATVVGYRNNGWTERLGELATEIAARLPVPGNELLKVLSKVRF